MCVEGVIWLKVFDIAFVAEAGQLEIPINPVKFTPYFVSKS
jgi:hypothetical protein